jgi:hypothetical protein
VAWINTIDNPDPGTEKPRCMQYSLIDGDGGTILSGFYIAARYFVRIEFELELSIRK